VQRKEVVPERVSETLVQTGILHLLAMSVDRATSTWQREARLEEEVTNYL
jgi:hypothetical protein